MPKISIIVPVYNVEKYIDRCINSILHQTFSDFELILIDDGTPDSSGEICENYAKTDNRIRVFHKQNGGLSDARNYGIDKAEGEYLTFIDSDDYVDKSYLEYLISLLTDDCKVSACNHLIVRKDNTLPNTDFTGTRYLTTKEAFEEALYHGIIDVSAWGKLYHRSIFETLRYPKGHLYEDTYVFGDILKSVDRIVFGSDALYYYVQRNDSIVHGKFNEKRYEYIESVKRFCDTAVTLYPDLENGCVRRMAQARLSVLRYMEKCDKKYKSLRSQLKTQILDNKKEILNDTKTPKRDKIAIILLSFGLWTFYKAWNLYEKMR